MKLKVLLYLHCNIARREHSSQNDTGAGYSHYLHPLYMYFIFWKDVRDNLKLLHFDANPIRIGYLVMELWAIHQSSVLKTIWNKGISPLCQYLKNNICNFRLPTHSFWSYHNIFRENKQLNSYSWIWSRLPSNSKLSAIIASLYKYKNKFTMRILWHCTI